MRRLTIFAAVALGSAVTLAVVAVGAVASGGRPDGERPAPPRLFDGAELERWRACMRERGFDLDGDSVRIEITRDGVRVNGKKVDSNAFRLGSRACGRPFPPPRLDLPRLERIPDGELRDRLERLERCLRETARGAAA